jgi:hypothetical protein
MLRISFNATSYAVLALLGSALVVWKLNLSFAASHPRVGARVALTPPPPDVRAPDRGQGLPTLPLGELVDSGAELRPSRRAQALNGQRVRLVGYMAELEEPLRGAFYLVPHPIQLDESGAGTGDLPLQSVLVQVPGLAGKPIPHVRGALEGIGVFEVGNRADDQGRVSNFRLLLDPDDRLIQGPRASSSPSVPRN